MSQLPLPELIVFIVAGCFYAATALVGACQLTARCKAAARLLLPLLCLAVVLQTVVLVFRAVTIRGIPLTGLFESMLVLTIVLSLVYLLLSLGIPQVWFGSLMSWVLLALVILSAAVAQPATEPTRVAVTPWVVFHGLSMVVSSASIVFSAATAFLYLLSDHRLKQKKVLTVLGRVPNTEWLRHANHVGLKCSFVSLSLGLASGLGLAAMRSAGLEMHFVEWLVDPKILSIAAAWLLMAVILCMRRCARLSEKKTAYATVVAVFLILFAFVGVALLGKTVHVFSMKVPSSQFKAQSTFNTNLIDRHSPQPTLNSER
jgi:ABC-type uncharacterized transport system permease subunit